MLLNRLSVSKRLGILVKDQYWLFVGMCLVAMLIGSVVPFGILLGPMMCGLYLTFFTKRRGQKVEFELLFKGFDYFGQSLIATLIHVVPIVVIVVPAYILFYVGLFMSVAIPQEGGGGPNPALAFGFIGAFLIFWLCNRCSHHRSFHSLHIYLSLNRRSRFVGCRCCQDELQGGGGKFLALARAISVERRVRSCRRYSLLRGPYPGDSLTFSAVAVAYEQVFGPLGAPISNLPPPPPTFK